MISTYEGQPQKAISEDGSSASRVYHNHGTVHHDSDIPALATSQTFETEESFSPRSLESPLFRSLTASTGINSSSFFCEGSSKRSDQDVILQVGHTSPLHDIFRSGANQSQSKYVDVVTASNAGGKDVAQSPSSTVFSEPDDSIVVEDNRDRVSDSSTSPSSLNIPSTEELYALASRLSAVASRLSAYLLQNDVKYHKDVSDAADDADRQGMLEMIRDLELEGEEDVNRYRVSFTPADGIHHRAALVVRPEKGQHNQDIDPGILPNLAWTRRSVSDSIPAVLIVLLLALAWSGSSDSILSIVQVTLSRWLDQFRSCDPLAGHHHREGVSYMGKSLDVNLNFVGVWLGV